MSALKERQNSFRSQPLTARTEELVIENNEL